MNDVQLLLELVRIRPLQKSKTVERNVMTTPNVHISFIKEQNLVRLSLDGIDHVT